jgi:S-adenosylmethionine synthetase
VVDFQNTEAATLRFLIGQWFNFLENKGINIETVHYDNGFLGGGVHANPAGDWYVGGFDADTGLTGRKLMVDNYGPQVSIGGGAFSGKDATKVDRSAAYMARKIAIDIAHSNGFKEVVVKLAYAIGVAEPVMVSVKGTNKEDYVTEEGWDISRYNLTPKGIIETLGLRNPQYEQTAQWGHFGNGFTWDK